MDNNIPFYFGVFLIVFGVIVIFFGDIDLPVKKGVILNVFSENDKGARKFRKWLVGGASICGGCMILYSLLLS